jgi:hypothetical protein
MTIFDFDRARTTGAQPSAPSSPGSNSTTGTPASPAAGAPVVQLFPEGRKVTVLEVKDALRHDRDHSHCDVNNVLSLADLERHRMGRGSRLAPRFYDHATRLAIRSRTWRASRDASRGGFPGDDGPLEAA